MMNVCVLHKSSMSIVNIVNVDSITFSSTTNMYTIHGAYATSPTTMQDITLNRELYIVRIMAS